MSTPILDWQDVFVMLHHQNESGIFIVNEYLVNLGLRLLIYQRCTSAWSPYAVKSIESTGAFDSWHKM